ncbi:MAG: hypothetical protein VKL39_22350 [Leptolyngbyaceae bacterium]|nr:hypothetical protein [Leptolyngbyaceae bacterium]
MADHKNYKNNPDANPDPITGEKGSHPVGTGVGAAGVGVIGTIVGGGLGGSVGAVVGAAVGSVAGGLLGKSAAEKTDPTIEDSYWRETHRSRPYVKSDYDYDTDYSPAYRTGYEGYPKYAQEGMTYADAESRLKDDYEKRRGHSRLDWNDAKYATRDAWDRVDVSARDRHQNDTYWRQNYRSRPYVDQGQDYDVYAPAYDMGYNSYATYGRDRHMLYEDAEPHIRQDYERHHGNSGLSWDKAKHAIKDAWHRLTDSERGRHENDEYWRNNYRSRPYYNSTQGYDVLAPAYRLGYDSYSAFGRDRGMTYDEAEPYIRETYHRDHQGSGLDWENAKHAVRDAWNRLTNMGSKGDRPDNDPEHGRRTQTYHQR